jgi:hypothetical protein
VNPEYVKFCHTTVKLLLNFHNYSYNYKMRKYITAWCIILNSVCKNHIIRNITKLRLGLWLLELVFKYFIF